MNRLAHFSAASLREPLCTMMTSMARGIAPLLVVETAPLGARRNAWSARRNAWSVRAKLADRPSSSLAENFFRHMCQIHVYELASELARTRPGASDRASKSATRDAELW